ncbi:MAG: glutamate synthase subunit beta [Desulfobacteraceae bacterium]|nr:MAG: glutamate synthase subunit beta [Desulfobacteraceae bacterium]
MGRPRAFLELKRAEPGYRPVEERVRDFHSVERQMNYEDLRRQSSRCMDCGTPFCHAYGCPLGNVIPEFNQMVYEGNWRSALELLLSTNNFPEFTGRVCPAPCEASCVAGLTTDPVTIRHIELAIIEKGFEDGYVGAGCTGIRLPMRVAIVGSGPAGLAAADTVNRLGYKTVVYESAPRPGGILKYGIPDFKLEKWVLSRRLKLMESQGILFETGVTVGEDISFKYLTKMFDAVCLACGAREPRDLNLTGRDLKGIHFAMDYLTGQNLANEGDNDSQHGVISARDKKVVVIGGGDTGSDCLGTALRQGAQKVIQIEILPMPPLNRADYTPWPLWPAVLRRTHAHKEGGELLWGVMTKEFLGEKGMLKAIKCVEVDWKRDYEGRPLSPVERAGTDFILEADMVLLAMGFTGSGNGKLIEEAGLVLDQKGSVRADAMRRTNLDGVFAAGDMVQGQSLVVKAIADGRRAGYAIDSYLKNKRFNCDCHS